MGFLPIDRYADISELRWIHYRYTYINNDDMQCT